MGFPCFGLEETGLKVDPFRAGAGREMVDEGRPRGAGSIPVAWEGCGAPTDTAGAGNRAHTGRTA